MLNYDTSAALIEELNRVRKRLDMIEDMIKQGGVDAPPCPLSAWLDAKVEIKANDWTNLLVLYDAYVTWSNDHHHPALGRHEFGRRMRTLRGVVQRRSPGIGRAQLSAVLR